MPEPMIVNIINFIRACEPRQPMDLIEPVREQMRLVRAHGLPATWLLQYDALIDRRYVDLLRENLDAQQEVGFWFEIPQPLVEAAGLTWRGRYPWDWHAHVAFSIGYTPAERERLADVSMARFKETFGEYPRSVGSWLFDAHLLGYLADNYGIVAACNGKDQWGTDGYTVWGGYWNQAYYPSRVNAYMPAQHPAAQIPVPVFRMLGSDPIYQYDTGLPGGSNRAEVPAQGVVSLEPVYKDFGGNPCWVRWFFDTMTDGPSLSFGYAQVGQENSFGWPAMAAGFTDQLDQLQERIAAGQVRVETLSASGAWFRARYPVTPAAAVTALHDWAELGNRSVWYGSRHYRANLFWHGDCFHIRDLHRFDETYAERYLTAVCPSSACTFDTLPLVEGFLWSDADTRAGLYPVRVTRTGLKPLTGGEPVVTGHGEDELHVNWPLQPTGALELRLQPETLTVSSKQSRWALRLSWGAFRGPAIKGLMPDAVDFEHEGFRYQLRCRRGEFRRDSERGLLIAPRNGEVILALD